MKTKSQLRREIRDAKIAMNNAERIHGFDSAQRKQLANVFWQLQAELGRIELAEVGGAQ